MGGTGRGVEWRPALSQKLLNKHFLRKALRVDPGQALRVNDALMLPTHESVAVWRRAG